MLQERGAELGAAGVVLADEQDGRSGVSHGFSFWEGLGGGEPGREFRDAALQLVVSGVEGVVGADAHRVRD